MKKVIATSLQRFKSHEGDAKKLARSAAGLYKAVQTLASENAGLKKKLKEAYRKLVAMQEGRAVSLAIPPEELNFIFSPKSFKANLPKGDGLLQCPVADILPLPETLSQSQKNARTRLEGELKWAHIDLVKDLVALTGISELRRRPSELDAHRAEGRKGCCVGKKQGAILLASMQYFKLRFRDV